MAQQPPTAQNYAIGHVGPYLPASYPNGKTVLVVRSREDPGKSVRANIRFVTAP